MVISHTTRADSQSSQGPVESCSCVLSLQPDQSILNQLTQRRWEKLQVLLHLEKWKCVSFFLDYFRKSDHDVCYKAMSMHIVIIGIQFSF